MYKYEYIENRINQVKNSIDFCEKLMEIKGNDTIETNKLRNEYNKELEHLYYLRYIYNNYIYKFNKWNEKLKKSKVKIL